MPEWSTLAEEIIFVWEDWRQWITEKFSINWEIIAERTTPYIENN